LHLTELRLNINEVKNIISYVTSIPYRKLWIDYDEEADVLYINFAYPPLAIEHEEDENGIIKNYDETGKLVGLTITYRLRIADCGLRIIPQSSRLIDDGKSRIPNQK